MLFSYPNEANGIIKPSEVLQGHTVNNLDRSAPQDMSLHERLLINQIA